MPREGHDRGGSGGQPPCKRDFNPRAPRGARRGYIAALEFFDGISIHVPREGHDGLLSVGRVSCGISIHVPREGHDAKHRLKNLNITNFNPRAPRGARLSCLCRARLCTKYFNPRAPRGARRLVPWWLTVGVAFQSTCPARGTTGCDAEWACQSDYFNPRAPRGARLFRCFG